MENYSTQKLKIFFWLAMRLAAKSSAATNGGENLAVEPELSALSAQLSKSESEKLIDLKSNFQNKSAGEKQKWNRQISEIFSARENFVDQNIHWSHLEAVLKNEIPAIRKIIISALSPAQRKHFLPDEAAAENSTVLPAGLKRKINQTFAAQFVALSDLSTATAFDRLSGEQFARLVRLAGIREVAVACVRITAVESVAAFLRRFPAEDARAIAAQLSNLPKFSAERLSFAEHIVQSALEIESQPAAMLDLLGIWLIGILLCGGAAARRIVYTAQKLPLEASSKLSEIIETRCRQTPAELQILIGGEIEKLAATIRQPAGKNNPVT